MRVRFAVLVSSLIGVLVSSGCATASPAPGSSASSPSALPGGETASGTALARALAATPASDGAVQRFLFSDLSAPAAETVQDWLRDQWETPYGVSAGLGLDDFGVHAAALGDILPSPGVEGSTAVTIGVPPVQASRFTGAPDPASAFADASGERSDLGRGTLLVRRADNEADLDDDEFPPALIARLNVAWYDDSTVIAGTTRAVVEEWAGFDGGSSLATHYAGIADCLGEVSAAAVHSAESVRLSADTGIGIGSVAAGEPMAQTLCIRADDVDATSAAVEDAIATGTTDTGEPIADLLGTARVDTVGGWVRVRTSDGTNGVFLQLLSRGELSAITG